MESISKIHWSAALLQLSAFSQLTKLINDILTPASGRMAYAL